MWVNDQPKSKYALVMCASNGYLPGVNATINSMDYYGNKLDLHFIHDDILPEGYWDEIKKAKLNYRLGMQNFSSQFDKFIKLYPKLYPNVFQYWSYLRYWYMAQIKDDYDAVGLFDGDQILLNDITPWFELVSGTKYILAAQHIFHDFAAENYNEEIMNSVQPICNLPLIGDPKIWSEVYIHMCEREQTEHEADMDCFNKSTYLCGKWKDIIEVLDCQWNCGYVWRGTLRKLIIKSGKEFLIGVPNTFRVYAIHNKWWQEGFRNAHCAKNSPDKERMSINLDLIFGMYKKFNLEYKVKYDFLNL